MQRTIARETHMDGRGLFSGEPARLTFTPADIGAGINFVRRLGEKVTTIPASVANVMKRPRRTCLKNGTLHIETVEHVLAALTGLGVTNATVTVSQTTTGELPMGDGSGLEFVHALNEAGVIDQDEAILPLIIKKPIQVTMGDATLAALPGPTDKLEIIYDFEAPAPVGRQVFVFHLGEDDFLKELAPARTFVFEHEANELRKRGFGEHLTTDELLVIAPNGPSGNNAFRFPDECVRHKVLDLIGDLTLVGRPLYGRLVAHKSGHELNHLMAKRLIEQADSTWRESLLHRKHAAMDIRQISRI
ncbi:MAG TPA: UDP-3-O-acyl-N-acetylglucosamine deacetylase, partial [Tepidisphaeraceae bacterium]